MASKTAPLPDSDNGFLKTENHATLLFVARRPLRLADGPGRGSRGEGRREKFGAKRNGPWRPCKPLISHKTTKGLFGNVWRKRPRIWKCLAWIWKSAPSPRSGEGKKLLVERVPLASDYGDARPFPPCGGRWPDEVGSDEGGAARRFVGIGATRGNSCGISEEIFVAVEATRLAARPLS